LAEPHRQRPDQASADAAERGWLVSRAPALRQRNFRLFIGTQLISLIGTWMQTLGQAWLIVVLTRDPFVLGLVTAAQALPVLLFSLLGGVVADRADKRRVLLITPSISLALASILGFLCLSQTVEVWHIVVLAFLLGTVNAMEIPTRQAFVVEMVGPDLLPSAVGLNAASYNGGRLIGPAIAGVIIGIATNVIGGPVQGTGVAFLVNAVSFLVVVVGFLLMRKEELFAVPRKAAARGLGAVAHEIGEGLRHVRSDRPVLLTLLVPGLISMLAINFGVLIPILALEYGLDAGGLGLLMAANGVGALVAALRVGIGGKAGTRALIVGAVVLGTSLVLAGIVTGLGAPLPVTAVLLFTAGAGAVSMRTATNTSVQLATAPELRGRVMSLFALVFEGTSPMGGLIAGAVAARFGGPAAFVVCGTGAVILILAGMRELLRIRLDGGRTSPSSGPRAQAPGPAGQAPGGPADPSGPLTRPVR